MALGQETTFHPSIEGITLRLRALAQALTFLAHLGR